MLRPLIQTTKHVLNQLKNKVAKTLHVVATSSNNHQIDEVKRYLDDQDRRHYTKNNDDVYSVTTVIDELEEGENEGLKWWKKHNDGQDDNPYWKHLLEYKRNRGTLAHHAAMADQYEALYDGEALWSGDETSSLHELMDRNKDQSFLYSIMADKGWVETQEAFENILQKREDITVNDLLAEDIGYFKDEYDKICEERGINENTLEAVEEMFVVPPNHEHDGYGGQADLVYRDPMTGGVVVADLKTSSAVRDKHKYQAAAYACAVEKTDKLPVEKVSRAEIIRIHPDSNESEVYEINDVEKYWDKFAEATKNI